MHVMEIVAFNARVMTRNSTSSSGWEYFVMLGELGFCLVYASSRDVCLIFLGDVYGFICFIVVLGRWSSFHIAFAFEICCVSYGCFFALYHALHFNGIYIRKHSGFFFNSFPSEAWIVALVSQTLREPSPL